MTSEDQLRAALLGGRQLTTMLASARHRDALIDRSLERQSALNVNEGILRFIESSPEVWRVVRVLESSPEVSRFTPSHHEALRHLQAYTAIDQIYEGQNIALLSAAENQWRSVRNDVLQRLERLYGFRDKSRVLSFLGKKVFLMPLLLRASDKIREFFGSSRALLDVSADPDDNNVQELWVRIQTDASPETALTALAKFDEEWWLEASASSENLLNFKLEYV